MTTTPETSENPAAAKPAPIGKLASVSLDCNEPAALAEYYGALLGMRRVSESPDGGIIALSDGALAVTMMQIEDHVPPTWPEPGQQKQVHLDISVTELDDAVARSVTLGATRPASLAFPRDGHERTFPRPRRTQSFGMDSFGAETAQVGYFQCHA